MSYILLTAARNEEAYIEKTIESVLSQTILPRKWVIVDDGSLDDTSKIVRKYGEHHQFICMLQRNKTAHRDFASKVDALNDGFDFLGEISDEFIGNLDADITFGPSYYADLIGRFKNNPSLGIAGGFVYEERGGAFQSRRSNSTQSVGHAAQLVRRECFKAIGGYLPLRYGGEDWCAEISARMAGWCVEAFPEIKVFHHKSGGPVNKRVGAAFRQGLMDYSLGSLALFELFKCLVRISERPFVIGAVSRLAGFSLGHLRRDEIAVPREVAELLRREQKERLWSWLPGSFQR
jgi:glycosyltransferase involved in cell wall biosynthesis